LWQQVGLDWTLLGTTAVWLKNSLVPIETLDRVATAAGIDLVEVLSMNRDWTPKEYGAGHLPEFDALQKDLEESRGKGG
jgi:hypothetical protein